MAQELINLGVISVKDPITFKDRIEMERVVPGTSKALGCHLVFIDTYGNTNFMVIDQQLELKIFTFYESFYF